MSEPIYNFQMTLRDQDGAALAERVVECEYARLAAVVEAWTAELEMVDHAGYVHVVRMR